MEDSTKIEMVTNDRRNRTIDEREGLLAESKKVVRVVQQGLLVAKACLLLSLLVFLLL